jgi:EmrB/QacA subfamily drug resistance transporter
MMIVVDGTAVVVALPTIKGDLGFSDASVVWVVNAYLVAYAGCLLLSGRLGDLFGHRRLFLYGLILFTAASLGCSVPNYWEQFVAARALQGVAAAAIATAALALVVNLFERPVVRANALGVLGFACSGGGAAGLLIGGVLTSMGSWHWIFLVNIPVGLVIYAFGVVSLPEVRTGETKQPLDIGGAITITTSLMVAVYAVVGANIVGWLSAQTLTLLLIATALLALFIRIEARAQAPLMPVGVFRMHNLAISCVVRALFSAGTSAGIFVSLYVQRVLGNDPLHVGLVFLPSNLIMGAFSLGLSARIAIRFGLRGPLSIGMGFVAIGIFLFVRAPVGGSVVVDVLPGLMFLGVGSGVSLSPLLVAGMEGVPRSESGLVSGILSTCSTMGGALGLALLASGSAIRTKRLLAAGMELPAALNSGYHLAFIVSAFCLIGAALLAITFLHPHYRKLAPDVRVTEI